MSRGTLIGKPSSSRFHLSQVQKPADNALALAVLVIPRALLAAKCTCEVKLSAAARTAEGGEKEEGFRSRWSRYPSNSASNAFAGATMLLCVCRHTLMKASFQRAHHQTQMPHSRAAPAMHCIARRKRDSNPRYVAVQQFSRLPPSTTRPFLPKGTAKVWIFIYFDKCEKKVKFVDKLKPQ